VPIQRRLPRPPIGSKAEAAGHAAAIGISKATPGLSLEFPMRPDFLAQVVIPRDMSKDEARRFTAFVMTLAHDFVPQDRT
jgi:hypothetical protein